MTFLRSPNIFQNGPDASSEGMLQVRGDKEGIKEECAFLVCFRILTRALREKSQQTKPITMGILQQEVVRKDW